MRSNGCLKYGNHPCDLIGIKWLSLAPEPHRTLVSGQHGRIIRECGTRNWSRGLGTFTVTRLYDNRPCRFCKRLANDRQSNVVDDLSAFDIRALKLGIGFVPNGYDTFRPISVLVEFVIEPHFMAR